MKSPVGTIIGDKSAVSDLTQKLVVLEDKMQVAFESENTHVIVETLAPKAIKAMNDWKTTDIMAFGVFRRMVMKYMLSQVDADTAKICQKILKQGEAKYYFFFTY